jgi:hypothetical protein
MSFMSKAWGALARRIAAHLRPPAPGPEQRTLVVSHHGDDPHDRALQNILQALRYAGQLYEVVAPHAAAVWPAMGRFRSVVIATPQLELLSNKKAKALASFVAAGGGLVVALGGQHARLLPVLGVCLIPRKEHPSDRPGSRKLRLCADLFPGLNDLEINQPPMADPMPGVAPASDAERVAELTSGQPLAWRRRCGRGRVIYWNSHLLAARRFRGLLVQSLLLVQPVAVMPVANVGAIQIDDFPAGYADLDRAPLRREFGMTFIPFLDRIWLPDLLQLGREFGIPFSFFAPFAYNAVTAPPFDFPEWEAQQVEENGDNILFTVKSARTVVRQGELGLHGYNHIPLTLDQWSTRAHMVAGLQAARERWRVDNLGPLPTSFVPAMNSLDAEGAQALTEAVPSLKVICSSYAGDFAVGEGREFGPEPWNPALFALPRITYGYEMNPELCFDMISQLATLGVWTHYLHPDDVIDNPEALPSAPYHRNPHARCWRGTDGNEPSLRGQFRAWLEFTARHIPWLRYVCTTDAAELVRRHLANRVRVRHDGSVVELTADCDTDVLVRCHTGVPAKLEHVAGLELLHQHRGDRYDLYILRMKAGVARVEFAPQEENHPAHGPTEHREW